MNIWLETVEDDKMTFGWDKAEDADCYRLLWKDKKRDSMQFKELAQTADCMGILKKMPRIPYYVKVQALRIKEGKDAGDDKDSRETEDSKDIRENVELKDAREAEEAKEHKEVDNAEVVKDVKEKTVVLEVIDESPVIKTPVTKVLKPQLEKLGRGLVAVKTRNGIFVSWRLFKDEVTGSNETGLTGTDFVVLKNDKKIAVVTDSTNYLDTNGDEKDIYSIVPFVSGTDVSDDELSVRLKKAEHVSVWASKDNYLDIPLKKPEGGVTKKGEAYEYHANDISVGDVDGDGEYEYIVKWDPSNSHDVSQKGYTGKVYIDCYKLDGRLMWRLDMGVNIRAGAHYTQFMVYDFNGDGRAEMAVKTAPGTRMHIYDEKGDEISNNYISLPQADIETGVTNEDNYVCSSEDYRNHLKEEFTYWQDHPEVVNGHWPGTLEECFGIPARYSYPLNDKDADELTDYFINVYAPSRSDKNRLWEFEGFVYEGPEYLTMFAGDGSELETIPFKFKRDDDGLMWGDYSMNRIEPCNRVDRFLSGVAYLDGVRPYLIVCRGYYTRTTLVAYDFFDNRFNEVWSADSGYVPMSNPFNDNPHEKKGSDPIYGVIAGQGNHSLSTADVDGDGYQEIIYGAACIDHDGSVLYSSYDYLPSGKYAKLGHGDAMHVANIDPDRPGLEIFNVFEGAKAAPYGYAFRDAESGKVYFGEYAETDLGRCMIGDICPDVRGLQVWVNDVYSVKGDKLDVPAPSTNMNIHWAADLTTQVTDGSEYLTENKCGVINDIVHGAMLIPKGTATNNGTKGNPCLVADLFGDFRDEIVLRLSDDSALRIYINTDITEHKLFTPLQDVQYRVAVAWQNNCYNQPGYTSYYYASDMRFDEVLPENE
jgi:hypothetical protein